MDQITPEIDGLKALSIKMDEVVEEVKLLRRSLLGTYDRPGGMAHKVVLLEDDLRRTERDVSKISGKIDDVQSWIDATKNRAVGVSLGLLIGSAGVGAGVATLVSRLLGGP